MSANVIDLPVYWEAPRRSGRVLVFQQKPGIWAVEDINEDRGHSGQKGGMSRREAVAFGWAIAEEFGWDIQIEGDGR